MTDIEIAHKFKPTKIKLVAKEIGIPSKYVQCYGDYKAKISLDALKNKNISKNHLILVTATTPTPAGEGKTTTSIGLADSLNHLGYSTTLALREPSLGPVFGIKGGATGGGYSQVIPMEDINLHFTGDFHAIGAANNLLAAMIDNHIFQGNELNIDPERVVWKHCVDMNDRQLRYITSGQGGSKNGVERQDGFDITVASEVMAILCLASSIQDLKDRLGEIIIGYTYSGEPVKAKQLNAQGAMATLLKDAIKPNLVQTLAGTPTFIHGGPFANIAHGCNSVIATTMARAYSDYTVTEAGFGSDLGAEKFFDIKCRQANIKPDAVVLVTTIRSIKMLGGVSKEHLTEENLDAIRLGFENTKQHYHNITDGYGIPCVLAINIRDEDTENEILLVQRLAMENNMMFDLEKPYQLQPCNGCIGIARAVLKLCEGESTLNLPYKSTDSITDKILAVAKNVYHAKAVYFEDNVLSKIERISWDHDNPANEYPICVAKTQYSFSDDPKAVSVLSGHTLHVKDIKICNGAKFIVVYTGNILTMPGLPKHPAAENIDIDNKGNIKGIF